MAGIKPSDDMDGVSLIARQLFNQRCIFLNLPMGKNRKIGQYKASFFIRFFYLSPKNL